MNTLRRGKGEFELTQNVGKTPAVLRVQMAPEQSAGKDWLTGRWMIKPSVWALGFLERVRRRRARRPMFSTQSALRDSSAGVRLSEMWFLRPAIWILGRERLHRITKRYYKTYLRSRELGVVYRKKLSKRWYVRPIVLLLGYDRCLAIYLQYDAARKRWRKKKSFSERWWGGLAIKLLGPNRAHAVYVWLRRQYWRVAELSRASRGALRDRRRHIAVLCDQGHPIARFAGRTGDARKGSMDSRPSDVCSEMLGAPALLRDRGELKVAVFIPGFLNGKGGAEKVAGRLAELLVKSGVSVHLVCRPPKTETPPYPLDGRIQVRTLFEKDDHEILQLRPESYDLIVGFGMHRFYSRVAHISRLLNVPFIVQECTNPRNMALNLSKSHGCHDDQDAYWLRQAVFAHASAVRLTVPAYAESVVDEVKPFTYAFYNSLVSPGRRSGTLTKKIACVSAMKNENKNGLVAVEAFCQFSSRTPGWSLHLYGENKFRREMERLMERFPSAAVIDHGIVHCMDEIYGDAHALIIPSYEEGLPNVVVEALSYGVPCIGFADCSGVNHIINHNETGLLVDRADPMSLETALDRLADPELRHVLSVGAKVFADEQFRPETWEANWLQIIQNSANQLNNRAVRQNPVARDSGDVRGARWRALLDTYLHFGE